MVLQLKSLTTRSSRVDPENIQLSYMGRSQGRQGYHNLEGGQNGSSTYHQTQQASGPVIPITTACTYDPYAENVEGRMELGEIHVRNDIELHGAQ